MVDNNGNGNLHLPPPLYGGESGRYECQECNTEFEVKLEPKAQPGDPNILPQTPIHCPFCGGEALEPV